MLRRSFRLIFIASLILFPSFSFATCPACLGSVGLPLRGYAFTTLQNFDFSFRYRFERQEDDIYYRNLQNARISLIRNFDRWSFGANIPISYANGFMRDGKFHTVFSIPYGVDVLTRYFILKAPFVSTRPILSIIGGIKIPSGYVFHKEHDSLPIPWGLNSGIAYSINIGGNIIFSELYYSYFLKQSNYSFGNRATVSLGIMRFFKTNLGISLNSTLVWQEGDKISTTYPSEDSVDVFQNTRRLTLDIGPRISLLIFDTFLDLSVGYAVVHTYETLNSPKYLWSFELGFSKGF
ncbi:MAG: hypothetical protein AB1410_06870 [Acidobacteriota bacterium]